MSDDTTNLLTFRNTEAAPTLESTENVPREQASLRPHSGEPQAHISLFERIKKGKYKAVFRVIAEGMLPADLLIDSRNKWYLIHYLVMHNKLRQLKVLVKDFDCNVNIQDAYNQTPLHMATLHKRKEIFQYLIHQPATQLDTRDAYGCTPLINSIKSKSIEAFIVLHFGRSSDATIIDTQEYTALHWAAYTGLVPLLKLFKHIPLIAKDATDTNGMTAIFKAISSASYEAVKYLIVVEKVDLSALSSRRQTPYEFAKDCKASPRIRSYVQKYSEYQRIEKASVKDYLFNKEFGQRIFYLVKYCLKKHGRIFNIVLNLLSMLIILYPMLYFLSKSIILNGLFFCAYILKMIFFILLQIKKNPGYLPMRSINQQNNAIAELLAVSDSNELPSSDQYCLYCLIRAPKSSYHCLHCNRCVSKFQFHLNGLCIGYRNFGIYFLHKLFKAMYYYIFILYCLCSITETITSPFPVNLLERWIRLFNKDKLISIILVMLLGTGIQVLYDLMVMFVGISQGITVHELRNMNLYSYLFELKKVDNEYLYVHKTRTYSDCFTNISNFISYCYKSIKGFSEESNDQYIQLAELNSTRET